MGTVPIEGCSELEALTARIGSAPDIAMDVEGDGLFRYKARLCTVQLATRDEIAILDTLRLERLAGLDVLLGADGPCKVVHDASFDARLMRDHGLSLGHVFDTSVAARFLSEPATGLASLLDKHLGVKLAKEQQQADWGIRPLDEAAVAYLEADVRHLLGLADLLREKVRAAGIGEEVALECAYVLDRALNEQLEERPPWVRIKGALDLPPPSQAVLRELAALREEEARVRDVPPFKVLRNEILLELVRRRPHSPAQALRVRGLGRGRARRLVGDLVEAIRRGEARHKPPDDELEPFRRPPPPTSDREEKKRRQKALSGWRRKVAQQRSVDPQVVLPGHCLTDIVAGGPTDPDGLREIAGIGEIRVERDGEAILRILRGPA